MTSALSLGGVGGLDERTKIMVSRRVTADGMLQTVLFWVINAIKF